MGNSHVRLGLDLGGSKIEAVLLDDLDAVCARERCDMPRDHGIALGNIRNLVNEVERQAGAKSFGAGVGMPGSLAPSNGLVRNAYATPFNGTALDVDLQHLLDRPVRLANDANCFALAEAQSGAARGHEVAFGVILGTGVGGGVVVKGEPLIGRNAIGGGMGPQSVAGRRAG